MPHHSPPDPANASSSVGIVVALHIGPRKKQPLLSVDSMRLVAGRGIEGDRFFRKSPGEDNPYPGREITLIESEALEALLAETGIELVPHESRRNVLTRGVRLNPLVGKQFQVGEVLLEGIELCEPCGHLELLTRTGVREGLLHRGGLRAHILRGGLLRVGDCVDPAVSRDSPQVLPPVPSSLRSGPPPPQASS